MPARDPRTGEITEISDAIREQIEWFKTHYPENKCARDINAGECGDFANAIADGYPGLGDVEIWSTGFYEADENGESYRPAHAFLKWKGRYYDAEAPEGVDDWRNLPLYRFHREGKAGHRYRFKLSHATEGAVI